MCATTGSWASSAIDLPAVRKISAVMTSPPPASLAPSSSPPTGPQPAVALPSHDVEPLCRPIIDLHMHTVYSDGASEPEQLAKAVISTGLKAFAVTDHDTTASFDRLAAAVQEADIALIPGIEINTHYNQKEIHVLGYFIDRENDMIREVIDIHRKARVQQAEAVIQKLRRVARVNVTFEDVQRQAHKDGCIGRPHIAKAIVQKGGAGNISEAFKKYLNYQSPTYLGRKTVTPHEAVEAIYESGGIPVIAHPGETPGIEDLTEELMGYGLMGLEAYHKSHSHLLMKFYSDLAKRLGLIVTGGTDYHGLPEKYPMVLNRLMMPLSVKDNLYKAKAGRDQAAVRVI